MSQHAVAIVTVCGALLLGALTWITVSNTAAVTPATEVEVTEENSDLLFAESFEDELEDDVEVTIESEFDGTEEVDPADEEDQDE